MTNKAKSSVPDTVVQEKRVAFVHEAHGLSRNDDELSFVWFQSAARDLAAATPDAQEKSRAARIAQLVKRLVKGYNRGAGLSQPEAEEVRDLTLALVKPLLPLSLSDAAGMTHEYPMDFLIHLSSLCNASEEKERVFTPAEQELRNAFSKEGPRLIEAAYLTYAPHLAEAEPDMPPYRIGEEWQRFYRLVEQLATLREIEHERDSAQTLLILMDTWQESGELTARMVSFIAILTESLLLSISPQSKEHLPPPPLLSKEAEEHYRPFTAEETALYRRMAEYEAAERGDDTVLHEKPLLRDAEMERYLSWRKGQEGQPGWEWHRYDRKQKWQKIQEANRYWQQVRERHRLAKRTL